MTLIDRRTMLAGTMASATLAAPLLAQTVPLPQGSERIPLWPGKAPGGARVKVTEVEKLFAPNMGPDGTIFTNVVKPTLTLLRPEAVGAKPNGAAILLIPGGGYGSVVIGYEGYRNALRFAKAGYTCYSLAYRMPADGWAAGPEAPLQDAQRALRMVRALGGREKYDAGRVGVIGFSAGGHLAAWLTSRAPRDSYGPVDAIDREPLKAAAAAYIYPVIQMDGPFAHAGSRTNLLGPNPTPEQMRAYSLDRDVSSQTPPVFFAHALDDKDVPPENSLSMLAALRAKGIPTECHLFEKGGHGFFASPATAAAWPDLFLAFAKRHLL